MRRDHKALDAEMKRIVRDTRARLSAMGVESSTIAAGLIMEALIEMYGIDYGDDLMRTVSNRCIGYSEELMGLCVVENMRNTATADDVRIIQERFLGFQEKRNASGRGVVEAAARAVADKYGPFPTQRDLKDWPDRG